MNKKFLSAILFGALMVSSTGTFVSCKDYDDDIDRIDTELSDLKSQLNALQAKIDAGKYITNVTTTADGITITLNDGTSYPITNGKDGKPGEDGKPGAAGDKIEVNEDGYFVINGKPTEWMAVKKDQLGQVVKVKTPTVSEDGCWVFYDEKGEAHPTTIKVAPVTAVENADKSWTLAVFAADGTAQTIKVPTAASLLSEIVVAPNGQGGVTGATAGVKVTSYTFRRPNEWKGPRALVANNSKVYAVTGLDIRVNPVSVDVTDVPFTLVNTKNATFPQIKYTATAESGDNALTFPGINGRAANTGNGLWTLGMKSFILSESEATTFSRALANASRVAYAVTAGTDTRSLYNVSITTGTAATLSSVQVRNMANSQATLATANPTAQEITVDVNKVYTIDPVDSEAFYDMYFTVSDLDKRTYGIVYDNEARTFTVTNRPDVVTTDLHFMMNVTTLDNNGSIKVAQYKVKLSSNVDAPVSYDAVTYNIANLYNSSANDDFFNIDLDILKNALGNNYATWGNNVELANTQYYIGEKANGSDKVALSTTSHALSTSIRNANNGTTTDVNTAKNIRVAVNKTTTGNTLKLDKQYYLTVEFKTASASLNSIVIPVTFTAPSVAEQFTPKAGYVVNGTINAYYYNVENKNIELNRYFDAMDTDATLAPKTNDAVAKVGNITYASNGLADLTTGVLSLKEVEQNAATGEELGYGKVLTINANNDFYKNSYWAYSTDSKKATSFTIKVMSPIFEGTITPATGSSIKVIANAEKGYDITADMITAKDYTGVTTYNIMPDKTGNPNTEDVWESAQIAKVSVAKKGGDNNTYIKSVEMTAFTAAAGDTPAKLGTINVKAEPLPNDTPSTIIVTVEDAWGYRSAQEVAVTIATK
mgnify:CR=1 FL=1